MKKVTFLAAAIALLGISSIEANAQSSTQTSTAQQEQTQQQGQGTQQAQTAQQGQAAQEGNKEKITEEQLPEGVKTALTNESYKDWKVSEVHKVSPAEGDAEGKVVYEVTFTNEQGQSGVARFDETGKAAASN